MDFFKWFEAGYFSRIVVLLDFFQLVCFIPYFSIFLDLGLLLNLLFQHFLLFLHYLLVFLHHHFYQSLHIFYNLTFFYFLPVPLRLNMLQVVFVLFSAQRATVVIFGGSRY